MLRYIVSRVIQGFVTVLLSTILIFAIINLAPGDPIVFIVGGGEIPPPDVVKKLREDFGLDRPVVERLAIYVSKVLIGDLGYSYIYRAGVLDMILSRLPATTLLAVSAYAVTTITGILIGMVAARKPFSLLDRIVSTIATTSYSLPSFFVAQFLLLLFAIRLGVLPAGGMIDPRTPPMVGSIVLDVIRHTILPLATLTIIYSGLMIRVARSAIIDAMQEDSITTLRAIGFSEGMVMRSAVRLASLPIITMANYELAFLISGALIVEIVYSWPGLGTLLYDSILKRDYPMVSGIFFVIVGFSVAISLVTDLIYMVLDPRVRLGKRV